MEKLENLKKDLKNLSDPVRAKNLSRFFKTGKGDYGEGDKFAGIRVPDIRKIAKKYKEITVPEIEKLVSSPIHEERMCALIIMTIRYQTEKDLFYNLYLKNRKFINNWDLIDVTAPRIVGDYLFDKPQNILYEFANSKNLWEKRISIISTSYFISKNDFTDTLKIAEILLNDKHDLIHKAVGWMLREIGNKNLKVEEDFLKLYYRKMPRTMLRYAIEKFEEEKRQKYLKGLI